MRLSSRSLTRILLQTGLLVSLVGCATSPPKSPNNICAIFEEKSGWYKASAKASERWGVPIATLLAFIYQESSFNAKAKPPRRKILWVIPGPRLSKSYGYTQAIPGTWRQYQRSTGKYGADRDDFADAVDFIGWYNHQSLLRSGIKKNDPYHLYLAYHEGHGGFNRRSFRNKQWLKNVAKKVSKRSLDYSRQLKGCEARLKPKKWFFGLFGG